VKGSLGRRSVELRASGSVGLRWQAVFGFQSDHRIGDDPQLVNRCGWKDLTDIKSSHLTWASFLTDVARLIGHTPS
jgi:hypothetical protein